MERIAVYPGTFDPLTNGHLDIAVRATKLFDRVIIGVAEENYKENLFTLEERVSLVREVVKGYERIEVMGFSGLLVDFVSSHGAIAIVRGLRAVSDFEYEFQMSLMNKKLKEDIETVFLMTCSEYAFLSSRIIKQIAALNGCIEGLVPPVVEEALRRKFSQARA